VRTVNQPHSNRHIPCSNRHLPRNALLPHTRCWVLTADPIGERLFTYLLMSIVIVPVLLGIKAATNRSGTRGLRMLLNGWVLYGVLWLCMLYFVKHRWVG
jgi:hypothetical protein